MTHRPHQVVLRAFDTSGNAITLTNTIVVQDVTAPSVVAPSNLLLNANPGICSATNVILGSPTFGDNCGGAAVTNDAPSVFRLGTNLVTWTATDDQGNAT